MLGKENSPLSVRVRPWEFSLSFPPHISLIYIPLCMAHGAYMEGVLEPYISMPAGMPLQCSTLGTEVQAPLLPLSPEGPGGLRAAETSWLVSSALSSGLYSYYHFPFLPWQGKGWNYWWNNVKTSWSLGDDPRCCHLKHLSDAFCCCLGIDRRVIPLQVTWKEMLWANLPRLWAENMQSWKHSGLWKCRS